MGRHDATGRQNDVHGFPYVFDESIRRHESVAIPAAVTGLDPDRADPHSTRRDHVTAAVSNTVRARQRDIPVPDRLVEHPGFRLATNAIDFQFRNFACKPFIWMVGAEIECVDPGVLPAQERLHLVVNEPQHVRGATTG